MAEANTKKPEVARLPGGRWRLLGLVAGVVVAGSMTAAGVAVWQHQSTVDSNKPSVYTQGGREVEGPRRATPTPRSTTNLRATIPGLSITQLQNEWSKRWHVTFQPSDELQTSADVTSEGIPEGVRVGTRRAKENPTDQPRTVYCTTDSADGLVVDRSLLRKMVDICFTPVFQGKERRDVPSWLYGLDFPTSKEWSRRPNSHAHPYPYAQYEKSFDRFTAGAYYGTGMNGGRLVLNLTAK